MKNVLLEQGDSNFVQAVIKSVVAGYSNDIIARDIKDLVKRKQASRGVLEASPEAIRVYAKNLKIALDEIADDVEQITCDCGCQNLTDDLDVVEDLDSYQKDVDNNKIIGIIKVNFKQNLDNLRKANRIEIGSEDLTKVKQKIFAYLKSEYKVKTDLTDKIFKSNLVLTDIENGIANVKYEIENAF